MKPESVRIKESVYQNLRLCVGTECLEELKRETRLQIVVEDDFDATPLFKV